MHLLANEHSTLSPSSPSNTIFFAELFHLFKLPKGGWGQFPQCLHQSLVRDFLRGRQALPQAWGTPENQGPLQKKTSNKVGPGIHDLGHCASLPPHVRAHLCVPQLDKELSRIRGILLSLVQYFQSKPSRLGIGSDLGVVVVVVAGLGTIWGTIFSC